MHLLQKYNLEYGTNHEAYAPFAGCRQFIVIQTTHIFHMEQLEDIMNTRTYLHIRFLGVHDIARGMIIARCIVMSGNNISSVSLAFCGSNGLFLSVSVPHKHFTPINSRHFNFFRRGIRLKIFPANSMIHPATHNGRSGTPYY